VVTDTKIFSKNNILGKYRISQLNARNIITLCGFCKSNKQTASSYIPFNDLDFMLSGSKFDSQRIKLLFQQLGKFWNFLEDLTLKRTISGNTYHLSLHKPSVCVCVFFDFISRLLLFLKECSGQWRSLHYLLLFSFPVFVHAGIQA
jgi:hypothetical protein